MANEDVGKILNREGFIKMVCNEAMKAHNSTNELFKVKRTESDSEVIFSFRGTWELKDWYSKGPFGATKINGDCFPSLRSIGNDEAAIVNEAFQTKFISILTQTQLRNILTQTQLRNKVNDEKKRKQIVFTGHSSGGPIAVLATIWFLEETAKPKDQTRFEPLCVTFGSPLTGNHMFSHALRREDWSRHFFHFVTRLDMVPRLFLSPRTTVSEPRFKGLLESVIPKKPKQGSSRHNPVLDKLFEDMIGNMLTLTSHVASKLTDSTNLLSETLTSFVELSPYRPFGNYVFIDESEKVAVLNNSEAVLQFLFFSCQPGDEDEAKDFAGKMVGDHLAYGDRLAKIKRWSIHGGTGPDDVKILDVIQNSADQFGLSQRGRLHLLAAGESEKQKLRNLEKSESKMQSINDEITVIENYKRTCRHRNIGYFDSFKQQKTHDDFYANVSRLKQAGIWDEIFEMLKSNKLPDDFEAKKEWIKMGTRYRRLVEPLDVANYYRHLKNEDTGNYMGTPGNDRVPRPKRYRFPQKWLEHDEKTGKDSCGESNFWAELEDLSRGGSGIDDFDRRAINLQEKLLKWYRDEVIDDDVFLSDSTFVKWWVLLEMKNRVPGIEKLVNKG